MSGWVPEEWEAPFFGLDRAQHAPARFTRALPRRRRLARLAAFALALPFALGEAWRESRWG